MAKVKITYKEVQKPILSIKDAIQSASFWPIPFKDFVIGDAEGAIKNAPNVIEGEFFTDSQYHFYMEQQVAIANRNEDGYDIYSSTQWTNFVHR